MFDYVCDWVCVCGCVCVSVCGGPGLHRSMCVNGCVFVCLCRWLCVCVELCAFVCGVCARVCVWCVCVFVRGCVIVRVGLCVRSAPTLKALRGANKRAVNSTSPTTLKCVSADGSTQSSESSW